MGFIKNPVSAPVEMPMQDTLSQAIQDVSPSEPPLLKEWHINITHYIFPEKGDQNMNLIDNRNNIIFIDIFDALVKSRDLTAL